MTKEDIELKNNKRKNIKLYYLYKTFSFDLLFYYAISFLFLTEYTGLSAAEIIFADAFYPIFKVLFQIPATLLIQKSGKRIGLIIGNISLFLYILFVIGSYHTWILIIGNIFMAIGFVLKTLSESNLLYDSLPNVKDKRKLFSKIEGKSSALYYLFEAISCAISGFLYAINPLFPILLCLICTFISFILAHMFKDVPIDITNPDETPSEKISYKDRFHEYIRNLKNAFRFIFSSPRLRSLIYFNAFFYSLLYLLTSYRRNLLIDIGLSAQAIGIMFAILGIISSISSLFTNKLNLYLKNKTLTYLSLYFTLSIIISGIVVALNISWPILITIVFLMQAIQFSIKGPYYTLIKQYLGSFASSSMRVKILAASNFLEGLVCGIISFIGSFLLTFSNTANASVAIGAISFVILILLLGYMNTKVGLKPEEYGKKDLKFQEVK